MSHSEKKTWRLSFTIYVQQSDYHYMSRIQSRILRYIEKTVSKKRLVRVSHSFTDKLMS